jgi:hypothetical protein
LVLKYNLTQAAGLALLLVLSISAVSDLQQGVSTVESPSIEALSVESRSVEGLDEDVAAAADTGNRHRDLGDVTYTVNGRWQEFRILPNRGSPATGCYQDCSTWSSSAPLGRGNNSPFSYVSQSCTLLQVGEGYWAGNAYYDVKACASNGCVTFRTSTGDENGAYTEDPNAAWQSPAFGRGQIKLPSGYVSFEITTNWLNAFNYFDDGAGWFRITTVPCDADRCLARGEWCVPGAARRCCGRRICRLKAGNDENGPRQCLNCVGRFGRCYQNSDCCNGRRCLWSGAIRKCF